MSRSDLTLQDVYRARKQIAGIARRTPLVDSAPLSEATGAQVMLKLENLQQTGSFKIRGATNKLLSLDDEARRKGVITVSSGNHGRAVSYVSRRLGIDAIVTLSEAVPAIKRDAIAGLGAETIIGGQTYDDATDYAVGLQKERGLTMIHPFDDPVVIAGQGTIGLELLEDFPQIDTVLVPLSGGGLIAGIALALKSASPDIRTIGVTMERGPAMHDSLRAGRVVEIVEEPTLADALAGGLGDNHYTFKLAQRYVDDVVLVSEEEIAAAMRFALEKHQLVVEGGGAVGIAALLYEKVERLGAHVAVVVSGGNVDLPKLLELVQDRNA
jgi:threonine dehydratase